MSDPIGVLVAALATHLHDRGDSELREVAIDLIADLRANGFEIGAPGETTDDRRGRRPVLARLADGSYMQIAPPT